MKEVVIMIDTLEKYRLFDLTLLSILAICAEVMGKLLLDFFPGAGFYLSFSILVALIAIVRWGPIGTIVYVLVGVPMIFLQEGSIVENLILYPVANIFIVITCCFFKIIKRDTMKKNNFYILCYIVSAYVAVSIGKGFATFLMMGVFLNNIIYYFITQLFNMVMVFIGFLIIKNKDSLLEKMDTYLLNE
jgi:hypothetical protein